MLVAGALLKEPSDDERLDGLDQRCLDRPAVRKAGVPHPQARGDVVVGGAPQLGDAVLDPQPPRAAVTLVGKSDAARVLEPNAVHDAIILLMGVAAHDQRGIDTR